MESGLTLLNFTGSWCILGTNGILYYLLIEQSCGQFLDFGCEQLCSSDDFAQCSQRLMDALSKHPSEIQFQCGAVQKTIGNLTHQPFHF